jgi:CheY-like chemotaxis protein
VGWRLYPFVGVAGETVSKSVNPVKSCVQQVQISLTYVPPKTKIVRISARFAGAIVLACFKQQLATVWPTRQSIEVKTDSEEARLSPTLLLLSDDEGLTDLVRRVVKRPWKLVRPATNGHVGREVFAQPNVRLVVLDDQTVEESDRGWLLAQIRRHLSGGSLLYVAGSQSDDSEKRARTNGAHYYVSKPLSLERFGYVLQSFLHAQQVDGRSTAFSGREPRN